MYNYIYGVYTATCITIHFIVREGYKKKIRKHMQRKCLYKFKKRKCQMK